MRCRKLPRTEHLKAKTDENSSVFVKRQLLGKLLGEVTPMLYLDSKPDSAFGTARAYYGTTTASFHSHQKTMRAFTTRYGRLISALHGKPL